MALSKSSFTGYTLTALLVTVRKMLMLDAREQLLRQQQHRLCNKQKQTAAAAFQFYVAFLCCYNK